MSNRALDPGWQCAALEDPTGRRGIWYRTNEDSTEGSRDIEICGGREGDDFYVRISETAIELADIEQLVGILRTADWMHGVRVDKEEEEP